MTVTKKNITKKSKAVEQQKAKDESEKIDPKRMENLPIKVSLSIGDFEIKELDFWTFTQLVTGKIGDYWSVFTDMNFEDGLNPEDVAVMLIRITSVENFKEETAKVFATYCGEPNNKDFENITFTDFEVLLPAVIQKIDIEGIKRFFSQTLPKLVETVSETATSTEPPKKNVQK